METLPITFHAFYITNNPSTLRCLIVPIKLRCSLIKSISLSFSNRLHLMSSSLLGIKKMEAALGESRSIRLFEVDIPISSPPGKKPLSSPLMMGVKKQIRLFGVDIAVRVMMPVKEEGLPAIKKGSSVPRVGPVSCCPYDHESISMQRLSMVPGIKQEPSSQDLPHSMAIVDSDVQDPLIRQGPRSDAAGQSNKRKEACRLDSTVPTKKAAKSDGQNSKKRPACCVLGSTPIIYDAVPLNYAMPIVPCEHLTMKMNSLGATERNLVIHKTLTASDCNRNQARLTMPCLKSNLLLNQPEQEILNSRNTLGKPNKIMVEVIDLSMRTWSMALKKWEYDNCSSYVLTSAWNKLAKANSLNEGETLEVWSFRVQGRLNLAISR